jgi:MFS family permease
LQSPSRDLAMINAAGFLRSLGMGFLGVVLGIHLFRIGLSSFSIGLVIAAGLAGSAVATIIVSFAADRMGRRRCLVILSLLRGMLIRGPNRQAVVY